MAFKSKLFKKIIPSISKLRVPAKLKIVAKKAIGGLAKSLVPAPLRAILPDRVFKLPDRIFKLPSKPTHTQQEVIDAANNADFDLERASLGDPIDVIVRDRFRRKQMPRITPSMMKKIGGIGTGALGLGLGARSFGGRRRRRSGKGFSNREIGQLLLMKSILGARHPAVVMYSIRAVTGRY